MVLYLKIESVYGIAIQQHSVSYLFISQVIIKVVLPALHPLSAPQLVSNGLLNVCFDFSLINRFSRLVLDITTFAKCRVSHRIINYFTHSIICLFIYLLTDKLIYQIIYC